MIFVCWDWLLGVLILLVYFAVLLCWYVCVTDFVIVVSAFGLIVVFGTGS